MGSQWLLSVASIDLAEASPQWIYWTRQYFNQHTAI